MVIRRVIGGVVGGALGATLYIGAYKLVGSLLGSALVQQLPVTSQFVAQGLLAGVGSGVIFAFLYTLMPASWGVRTGIVWLLSLGGELLLGLPSQGLGVAGWEVAGSSGIVTLAAAFALYAVVLTFVLRQILDLPLPVWKSLRRSNEFADIRAESH